MPMHNNVKLLFPAICLLFAGCAGTPAQPVEGESNIAGLQEDGAFYTEESDSKEPQEISIVLDYFHAGQWSEIIEDFNAQNADYHVTVLAPQPGEDMNAFRDNIMEEITAGQGPDILDRWYVNIYDYAAAGYIQPWGEVFDDNELQEFLPGIMNEGKIKGETYGILYGWRLQTLVTSGERAGGKESWTWSEMMDCVKNSDAMLLAQSESAYGIIDDGILSDKSNSEFIDWENGTCDFSGSAFLEFLQFAKEYGTETSSRREVKAKPILTGESLAWEGTLWLDSRIDMGSMNFFDTIFENDCVYIGYPHADGKGNRIYIDGEQFFLNGASEQKDGAVAFVKYFLSEEVQNRFVEEQYEKRSNSYFSVRYSAINHLISLNRNRVDDYVFWTVIEEEIEVHTQPMSQKQEEQFWGMIERSSYYGEDVIELYRYTNDALYEFFHGEQTAEETAAALQRSVEQYFEDMNNLELPVK